MSTKDPLRDAIRLLYIFTEGSRLLDADHESGAESIFCGRARLLAFDFWIRNPDYLADELLNKFEENGDSSLVDLVRSIFESEEPDIRRLPMLRYRFGAYERLDDALAILRSRELIMISVRRAGTRVIETDYLVFSGARVLAGNVVSEFPQLAWYQERARVVAELAGERGGTALKEQQHRQIEYHETKLGGLIPPITERVRERLAEIESGLKYAK